MKVMVVVLIKQDMFTFKNIILAGVLILLLTSVAVQAYNMWGMSSAAAATTLAAHWTSNKVLIYSPSIINIIGMALVGVLFVMG